MQEHCWRETTQSEPQCGVIVNVYTCFCLFGGYKRLVEGVFETRNLLYSYPILTALNSSLSITCHFKASIISQRADQTRTHTDWRLSRSTLPTTASFVFTVIRQRLSKRAEIAAQPVQTLTKP